MTERLMRVTDVMEVTKLSRAEIYRRVKAGTFPRQTRISHRVAAWAKSEVDRWVAQRLGRTVDLSDLIG